MAIRSLGNAVLKLMDKLYFYSFENSIKNTFKLESREFQKKCSDLIYLKNYLISKVYTTDT